MIYTAHYKSPIGNILLAEKEEKLIGLWLENQKYYLSNIKEDTQEADNIEILEKTKKWLNQYFKGEKPKIKELDLAPIGSEFRQSVWNKLCQIPYGQVVTYSAIAKAISKERGINKMSAQAVGGAVAHNPISIIIPCHRVVGTTGDLTGYAGGIDKKIYLLKHEQVSMSNLFIPKNQIEKEK